MSVCVVLLPVFQTSSSHEVSIYSMFVHVYYVYSYRVAISRIITPTDYMLPVVREEVTGAFTHVWYFLNMYL